MRSSRILIVDDDPALLIALSSALKLRMPDVSVDTCDSAITAVEKVRRADYDAVVTDIKLPGMDGLALLNEIRQLQPELPTLLITGHGQHDLAIQALRGGAFDFIQKPIERDYFVAALTRAIRMRKMERRLQQQQQALQNHAHELEQAVATRTAQLHESNRRKDEFLAMLSHELRNPLAPLCSGLEILALEGGPQQETIRVMQGQLQHLVRLVDDLLDAARIVRGKITLRKQTVELCNLVERSVRNLRSVVDDRQLHLSVSFPPHPVWLHADPVRLAQIVENLLRNAAKYTDPGGRLALHVAVHDTRAVISLQDSGIGIEPQLLPCIFDLFMQSSRSVERSQGGLGIGLTLVRRLVEMHHGSISAHSEGPGKGSTFVVGLPTDVPPPHSTAKTAPQPTSHGHRILVVDDNIGAAKTLSQLLTQYGDHQVETAYNGPAALEKIQRFRPHVVLLDIAMPHMDGTEVARIIRSRDELRDVLLVALTGYGQDSDRLRSKQAGFDRHLVKPVQLSELDELLLHVEHRD